MLIKNYAILSLVISMTFASCKKDDFKDDASNDSNSQNTGSYTGLSNEEHKANLESAGINLLNEMNAMLDVDAIAVSIHFSELSGQLMLVEGSSTFMTSINMIASLGENENAQNVLRELKYVSEEPGMFSEIWDELVGTYSWNATSESWSYTEGGNEIVFEFPGLKGDATNTAVYTINNFSYVDIDEPAYEFETDGFEVQLPTGINAYLTYNEKEIASYAFSANYQADGIPLSFISSLSIEDFVFSAELIHTVNQAAGITYSLKHANKNLIELHVDASGDWSKDNIDDNTVSIDTTYIDEDGVTHYIYGTEIYIENILKNSNAHIQLMNVKVAGSIDFANLVPKVRALLDEYYGIDYSADIDEGAYINELVTLYNEYTNLVVVYADNNEKIAVAEVYAYKVDDDFDSYWTMQYRFVFSDGSKVDAKTYFAEGFEELMDELDEFINDLEEKYY